MRGGYLSRGRISTPANNKGAIETVRQGSADILSAGSRRILAACFGAAPESKDVLRTRTLEACATPPGDGRLESAFIAPLRVHTAQLFGRCFAKLGGSWFIPSVLLKMNPIQAAAIPAHWSPGG